MEAPFIVSSGDVLKGSMQRDKSIRSTGTLEDLMPQPNLNQAATLPGAYAPLDSFTTMSSSIPDDWPQVACASDIFCIDPKDDADNVQWSIETWLHPLTTELPSKVPLEELLQMNQGESFPPTPAESPRMSVGMESNSEGLPMDLAILSTVAPRYATPPWQLSSSPSVSWQHSPIHSLDTSPPSLSTSPPNDFSGIPTPTLGNRDRRNTADDTHESSAATPGRRRRTSSHQSVASAVSLTTHEPVQRKVGDVDCITFLYSRDRMVKEYTIQTNMENISCDLLPLKFKTQNAIYPRANVERDQYGGNRWDYETSCNMLGWKLAWLNKDELEGKRGLIQRAVDAYRNCHIGTRSRRVTRHAKVVNGTLRRRRQRKVYNEL